MNMKSKVALLAMSAALMAVPAAFAQNFTVDFRANLTAADAGNYVNWSVGSLSVKDKLDAASGASMAKSTEGLNAFRYDTPTTKKLAAPGGLRSLFLYAVADFDEIAYDSPIVTVKGKQVTVTYVHRGTVYKFVTDKDGNLDVLTGVSKASVGGQNANKVFELKSEFVKKGGDPLKMADLDLSKVTFSPDAKATDASRWYEGKLAFAYDKGVLTVKGTLTEKKK